MNEVRKSHCHGQICLTRRKVPGSAGGLLMGAGCSGKSGRFECYRETGLEYAFILSRIGISK